MNPKLLRQRIREIVEPTLGRMGFDLVAVEMVAGRRATLRLSIDAQGGVGIDDLTRVTHRLSPLLDEADPIASAYDLEVSSPGIERPVQRLSDFSRFLGFKVRIVMEEGVARRRYTGQIESVGEDTVGILVDGVSHELAMDQIERAHLVLDLSEFERLGTLPWPQGAAGGEPLGVPASPEEAAPASPEA